MNWLRTMDLYKGLILGCLLLLLPTGWWIMKLRKDIEECENSIKVATRPDGVIADIGQLQKKLDTVHKNIGSGGSKEPVTYFEKQIISSGNGISSGDFTIPGTKEVRGKIDKQQFTDEELRIDFAKSDDSRTERSFTRSFIDAVLYNCESGAGSGASVWKLRKLRLVNATTEKLLGPKKTPPAELEDRWLVKDLVFARRLPNSK